ncbi:MAG: hypothetical protein IKE36_05975 [Solobacterium sp.]|nr:hypothetical protein [Solobacterium sp.]
MISVKICTVQGHMEAMQEELEEDFSLFLERRIKHFLVLFREMDEYADIEIMDMDVAVGKYVENGMLYTLYGSNDQKIQVLVFFEVRESEDTVLN